MSREKSRDICILQNINTCDKLHKKNRKLNNPVIGGFVFLFVQQKAELAKYEADYALPTEKVAENEINPKTPSIAENNLPPAKPGFKWVPHGDHYDQVPIAEANETPVKKTYDKPLTYDAELFRTNPVKSLSLEMEARGHWGAGYIPPFPPDDLEAQELARYQYMISYMNVTDAKELWDLVHKKMALWRRLNKKYGKYSARAYDLARLTWPSVDYPSADFESLINSTSYPSEYFSND